MLVKNLGETRIKLINSFRDLTDEQLNQKFSCSEWSISQILYHLYLTEKEMALYITGVLHITSEKVDERDLSFLSDCSVKKLDATEPPEKQFTKGVLIQLLEESRFHYVQTIFNETHVKMLAEKSVDHPDFGQISLKNLLDYTWMHEQFYIEKINALKQELSNGTQE